MNNIEEIMPTIYIGLVVATFLLNTGRALKTIELCKENLVLLNNIESDIEEQIAQKIRRAIYEIMLTGYCRISDNTNAIRCGRKLLVIYRECGERVYEGKLGTRLAQIYLSQSKYVEARKIYERTIIILRQNGDKKREAIVYGNLGTVFQSVGEYVKAEEYLHKALAIIKEIGDRTVEASCYGNLGTVFESLGQYVKAKTYYEKALAIRMETGDKEVEATYYDRIGMVLQSLGQYVRAKEYHEKALAITRKLGDKEREADIYGSMGHLFHTLGEYVKAKEYVEKELNIRMEIGDREGEADVYANLGAVYQSLRKYRKSEEYYNKALAILSEIGRKGKEATVYGNLGVLQQSLGDNMKAKKYYEKSLTITLKIGHRKQEAITHFNLGSVFQTLDKYVKAEEYFEKALTLLKITSDAEIELECYLRLTFTKLSQKKFEEALSCLSESIKKYEDLRGVNVDSDHIKVSLADQHSSPYQLLSRLFCATGYPKKALNVEELGRARALADLMATQYSAEKHKSADPQSWTAIENVMKKESNCQCLYISYHTREVFLWLLEKSGAIHFRNIRLEKNTLRKRLAKGARNVDEFFAIMAESFRSFGILPDQICEDRSLNDNDAKLESCPEESLETFRQGKDKDDPKPNLTLFYEMLINPVRDLLDEPEIIIVPDRGLYRVPFPALLDESGKYLTEKFRIRIVPSLTTLKFIQESPEDYHSQTGALIVGDPDVGGEVIYRGSVNKTFVALPGARKEAEMIGELLGVEPLLGQHATKPVVLARISSVSLIHIAAHGNAERGEIALAPAGVTTEIPQEDDYLLKMSDISQVQVRAKLVVLSCCHSGRGQIRTEGVVGIARAFLGSGARSVFVSLWALEDRATQQLMSLFYENLVRGEKAGECLHKAMNWMRDNGFTKVSEWAPFMLIGDNVTFVFGK